MPPRFTAGDAVQTPFGKGVVREVRNSGRVMVEVGGRSLVVNDTEMSPLATGRRRSRPRAAPQDAGRVPRRAQSARRGSGGIVQIDLHGLMVAEALARVERALNDALTADVEELRIVHGRSGGRIRAALHRRLREIPSVQGFQVDPANDGVTIVRL